MLRTRSDDPAELTEGAGEAGVAAGQRIAAGQGWCGDVVRATASYRSPLRGCAPDPRLPHIVGTAALRAACAGWDRAEGSRPDNGHKGRLLRSTILAQSVRTVDRYQQDQVEHYI